MEDSFLQLEATVEGKEVKLKAREEEKDGIKTEKKAVAQKVAEELAAAAAAGGEGSRGGGCKLFEIRGSGAGGGGRGKGR